MPVYGFCLLVILFYLQRPIDSASISFVKNETGRNDDRHNVIADTEVVYCPIEFFDGVRFSLKSINNVEDSKFYKVDETATVRCDAYHKKWGLELEENPENYIVYPDSVRKCQPNGTWSGSPPVCVNTYDNVRTAGIAVVNHNITECQSSSDSACLGEWTRIGLLHGSCNMSDRQRLSLPTTKDHLFSVDHSLIFNFDRKIYLSFLVFGPTISTRLHDVSVYARNEDIIQQFSEECMGFQRKFYDEWSENQESNELGCSVVQLGVFADQLKITYSPLQRDSALAEPSNVQETLNFNETKFYRILEVDATEADGNGSLHKSCSMPPEIPHSKPLQDVKPGAKTIRYECLSSHTAVDPSAVFGHSLNDSFTLSCIKGDWMPYPFPVCRERAAQVTDSSSVPVEEGINQARNRQVIEPHFSLPQSKLVEACYWFAIGLLASSLLTLFICIRYKRFRRFVPIPSSLQHSSSLHSGSQIESTRSVCDASEVHNSDRKRSLLDDHPDDVDNVLYHTYYCPNIDGYERIEKIPIPAMPWDYTQNSA